MSSAPGPRAERPARADLSPWIAAAGITVLVAVVLLLALSGEVLTQAHTSFDNPWDHHKYIYLAEHGPGSLHLAPFGWRLAVPTVASVLPMEAATGFRLVSVISVLAAAAGSYALSRAHGFDRGMSAGAVVLYLSVPAAVKYVLYNFWLPDAALFAIIAWTLVLVKKEKLGWAAVLLVVGALTKESILLVIPLVYSLRALRLVDWRAAGTTVAVAIPAVITAAVLRFAIPAWNTRSGYIEEMGRQMPLNRFDDVAYTVVDQFRAFGAGRLGVADLLLGIPAVLCITFGAGLVLLAVLGAVREPIVALRYSPLVLVSLAQLLVAYNVDRLVVLAFPAVIVLSLYGITWLAARVSVPAAWFFLPAAAVLVAHLWSGVPRLAPLGDNLVWLGGLAVVVLGGFAWRAITPIADHDL